MKRSNVVNLMSLTLTPRSLRKRKMHGKRNGRKEVGPWTLTSITLMVQNLIYKVFEVFDTLGYLIRFLAMDYNHNVIIPATNQAGSRRQSFKDLSLEELTKFLSLMYAMEIVKMPNRRMYWDTSLSDSRLFPNMNFSKYMSCHRFEEILSLLQFSFDRDKDKQIMKFLSAVNDNLLLALTPGKYNNT